MQAALNVLRGELATIDAKRNLVLKAIAAVEKLVPTFVPTSHVVVVDEAHAHTPGQPATPIRDEVHDAAPADPIGAQRVEALLSAERRAVATLRQDERRVVDVLATSGPVSLSTVAAALGIGREQARYLLTKLRKAGTVAADGETSDRVFRLAQSTSTRRPAREGDDLEVVWDGATKQSPAEVLQARREARS